MSTKSNTSGRVTVAAELTWQGNHLCQGCGANLDTRTPDIIELLDVQPHPMFFIPICRDCCNGAAHDPGHMPISASVPASNLGTKAKYDE